MTRRNILKIAAVVTAVPVIALLGLVLYLQFADLSGWRDTVAEKVSSEILGREITIAGEFKPEIGLTTRLTAGDITLANPGWSDDPTMASVQRLTVELRLLSLVSGPLTFHDIEIDGARILLEKDADGRANWDFDTGESSKASSGPLELVLQHVLLEDVQLTWREPSRTAPLVAEITHFETAEDHAGMLDLEFEGGVDDRKIELSGRLGTLSGLLNAAALEYDLSGTLDGVRISSRGNIKELKTLDGVDVTADVHGDDLGVLRDLVDLPPELGGPFSVSATVSPTPQASGVHLDATGCRHHRHGRRDCRLARQAEDPRRHRDGVGAEHPHRGRADRRREPPGRGFSVSGGVRWEGFPITFRKVEITVGENSLWPLDGVLGAPPAMMGTDFSLRGQGPDVSTIGALVGIDLPRDRFFGRMAALCASTAASGRGCGSSDREHAGQARWHAWAILRPTPAPPCTVHAEGPNIAQFNHLIGAKLPAQPFTHRRPLATDEDGHHPRRRDRAASAAPTCGSTGP